jgi:hypothetical protein
MPIAVLFAHLFAQRVYRLSQYLYRLGSAGAVAVVGLASTCGANPVPPPSPCPFAPQALERSGASTPCRSSMDLPVTLITRAQERFRQVKDYTCVLVKRERIAGELTPKNVVQMKVRNRPFNVHLRWRCPCELAGQEVCYVADKNEGKMRVRAAGLLGAVGFISLDPEDPRARQTSNHAITDAGLGNLIDRLARSWQAEQCTEGLRITLAEYEYAQKRCTRIEVVQPEEEQGRVPFQRTVVFFDQDNHLPIRVECYNWPSSPGEEGDLQEEFSFTNLVTNVGLGKDEFDH